MARIAHTHKKTVRPNFEEAESSNPSEEVEDTFANLGGERAEISPEAEETESEVLYNDDLGSEISRDEGVLEPAAPLDLTRIDFGQLPLFRSTVGIAEVEALVRKYPFR